MSMSWKYYWRIIYFFKMKFTDFKKLSPAFNLSTSRNVPALFLTSTIQKYSHTSSICKCVLVSFKKMNIKQRLKHL